MKEKVKINGVVYEIDNIRYMRRNLLYIWFDESVNVPEFTEDMFIEPIELLTRGGDVSGVIEGFTTIYSMKPHSIVLSNDGTIFIEPVIDDGQPIVENNSIDENPPTIDIPKLRDEKISEIKSVCDTYITDGVDVEVEDGYQHFSYTLEDQTNIKDAFDLAVQTGLGVPYHCDGQGCKLYSADDIVKIFVAEKINLTYHTTYFNQLRQYIMTLEDADAIRAIYYGIELPEPYLTNLNQMMDQARLVVNTLLASLQPQESETVEEMNTEKTAEEVATDEVITEEGTEASPTPTEEVGLVDN